MNKNVVIILAGAILTAFLVAFMVQAILSPDANENANAGADLTEILVAAEKLSEGEILDETKVKWQPWPKTALIGGIYERDNGFAIADLDIMGSPVRRNVELGEPVLSSVVLKDAGENFLAASLQPGMLAYSIPVSASSSVGGFARPGDHVDVILTYDVRVDNRAQERARGFIQRYSSETVLRDVRVMAVDQDAKQENREAKIGKVVTLEVTPDGAEVLALSLEMGDISLALRRLGGEGIQPEASDFTPTTDVGISKTLQRLNNISGQSMIENEGSINSQQAMPMDDNPAPMGATKNIRVYSGGETDLITVPMSR